MSIHLGKVKNIIKVSEWLKVIKKFEGAPSSLNRRHLSEQKAKPPSLWSHQLLV